jgi:hypothetical protein
MKIIKAILRYPRDFFFENIMLTLPILGMSIYIFLPVSPQFIDFLIQSHEDVYVTNQVDLKELAISTTKGFSAIGGIVLVALGVTILAHIGESLKPEPTTTT